MEVVSPLCPITVNSATGTTQTYYAKVDTPLDMPNSTYFYTDIYNYNNAVVKSLQNWWYSEDGRMKSLVSGDYLAGSAGNPVAGLGRNVQDLVRAYFAISSPYGMGPAEGFAVLPYRWPATYTASQPSQEITSSQWMTPKAGLPTFVRVVPQLNETGVSVGLNWYFDGNRLIDSVRTTNPLNPVYWTARTYTAKVPRPGTHTWKVVMTYGVTPPLRTQTVTWTQTWY